MRILLKIVHLAFLTALSSLLFASQAPAQSAITTEFTETSLVSYAQLPVKLIQADLKVSVFDTPTGTTQTYSLGTQQLPWRWDFNFLRQKGVMHFKFDVPLSAELLKKLQSDNTGLGLAASNMGNRHRVRINGGLWQSQGWTQVNSQQLQKPSFYMFAAKDLRLGNNVIELEIRAEPANNAGLTVIEIGQSQDLMKAHSDKVTNLYAAFAVVVSLTLLAACVAAALAILMREKFYIAAALAECCFFLRQLGWLVDYPTIPTWVFNAMMLSLHLLYVGFMCWISQLLINKPPPWLDRLLKTYMLLCVPILVLGMYLGDYRFYPLALGAVTIAMSTICQARIIYHAIKSSSVILYAYAFGGLVSLVTGGYDYSRYWSQAGFGSIVVVNYAFAILSAAMLLLLVLRYLNTRHQLLELRAARNLEAETATLRERQRLMQDIHDSVGSQLVGLITMLNGGAPMKQIKEYAQHALSEMRLAVDAINTVDGDLSLVLANMRHRLQPLLDAAKLTLIWKVNLHQKLGKMSYRDIKNIQRIILEVISNIVQHADAKQVLFSFYYDARDNMCWICIADDGSGFDSNRTRGRGLKNVQDRAEALGAILTINQNYPRGTVVKLGILASQ